MRAAAGVNPLRLPRRASALVLHSLAPLREQAFAAWLDRVRDKSEGTINDTDGIRIDWLEGWVHLRPSNTEPIARVISEAADEKTALALVERVTALRG